MCWRNICQTVRYRKSWSDFIPDLVKLLRCCHEKSVQNKRPCRSVTAGVGVITALFFECVLAKK